MESSGYSLKTVKKDHVHIPLWTRFYGIQYHGLNIFKKISPARPARCHVCLLVTMIKHIKNNSYTWIAKMNL